MVHLCVCVSLCTTYSDTVCLMCYVGMRCGIAMMSPVLVWNRLNVCLSINAPVDTMIGCHGTLVYILWTPSHRLPWNSCLHLVDIHTCGDGATTCSYHVNHWPLLCMHMHSWVLAWGLSTAYRVVFDTPYTHSTMYFILYIRMYIIKYLRLTYAPWPLTSPLLTLVSSG